MKDLLLILASFLACSVEMVEATTIVLAVGVTKGWRSALTGVAAGLVALTAVIGILIIAGAIWAADPVAVGAAIVHAGWFSLIVIGVRGRKPLDLTVFGSTTNQVVRRASCPVLTLKQ